MNKEGQELVADLQQEISQLKEVNDCVGRQRDSVIDQSQTLLNERNALLERNRELHCQLRKTQEQLDKHKQPESLEDAMQSEMNKYGHVFMNNWQEEIDLWKKKYEAAARAWKLLAQASDQRYKHVVRELDNLQSEQMRIWLDNGRQGPQPKM